MIYVGNRYKPETLKGINIYCGRGTPLGNNHIALNKEDRDRVCELYRQEFPKLREQPNVRKMLIFIWRLAKTSDVTLVCSCYPKPCHCDTIKEFLDQFLNDLIGD